MNDPQPAILIDISNIASIDTRFAAMDDRLKSYEDMHDRFTSLIIRYLDTLSTHKINVKRDIGKLNDQHDFQEESSTSIDSSTGHRSTAKNLQNIFSTQQTQLIRSHHNFTKLQTPWRTDLRSDVMTSTFQLMSNSVDQTAKQSGYRRKSKPFRDNSHLSTRYQHRPTENTPNRSTTLHQQRSIDTWSHRSIPYLHQTTHN